MTAKPTTALTWTCAGNPPHVAPCDATGSTDASAERHTRDSTHATVTHMRAVSK